MLVSVGVGSSGTIDNTTQIINYTPESIDHYTVIVKLPEYWEEIHDYIINENEIDGIPNRRITCLNSKEYSLRTAIYEMSQAEADVLKTHPKVETVELSKSKYPQQRSYATQRYRKDVAFTKTTIPDDYHISPFLASVIHVNGKRSNWGHLFVNDPRSNPFQGVGIATTTIVSVDVPYSLDGEGVDAIINDDGCHPLHPEFIDEETGAYRARDLILDGPYYIDPDYFTTNNYTYTKVIDSVTVGVGIDTTRAHLWWTNASNRSAAFQNLGTVSSINSNYTMGHAQTKTVNSAGNQMNAGHGTACCSQVGGKTFGLAFKCNLWSIRIAAGGSGYIDASIAIDCATLFHNAKKLKSNDPDPTLTSNSYHIQGECGNVDGTTYTHTYRGNTTTYEGTGTIHTPPTNAGACANVMRFSQNSGSGSTWHAWSGIGQFNNGLRYGAADNTATEDAIAAGVIMVNAAGNHNQKLCDSKDIDYNNTILQSSTHWYVNRVGGTLKGWSGPDDSREMGAIRVGALDCAVEPADEKQGSPKYSIRKTGYSANGPMISIWAPAHDTFAAGYGNASYEKFAREDDSDFYDTQFTGTSSACPNCASVIALYLSTNRKAKQSDVFNWLDTHGSKEIALSDPYTDVDHVSYWNDAGSSHTRLSSADNKWESYNCIGCGNLRGATKKVLHNPYANNRRPSVKGDRVTVKGVSFKQT